MNEKQLKRLYKVLDKLETLRAEVENIREEMQESYDSQSNSMYISIKGEEMADELDNLEYFDTAIYEARDYLLNITENNPL